MHGADHAESFARMRRERRAVWLVVLALLLVTALVCPLGFTDLRRLLLLVAPFALMLLAAVLLLPLSRDREAEKDQRRDAATLAEQRQAEAARHAVRTTQAGSFPVENMAALAEAAGRVGADHGIHFGCAHMPDEDFLQAFHAWEIRPAEFRHGDHLRYTLLMLRRVPASLAGETLAHNLRMYLRHVCGSDALFHATRTHAWIAVLRGRADQHPQADFAELLTRYPAELKGNGLARFYSDELLNSDAARKQRIEPDREPLPRTVSASKMHRAARREA